MGVIIGMDPHKRSATVEVIDERGRPGSLLVGTARTRPATLRCLSRSQVFPHRIWAVEGCNGIGRHLAHRLVHDGETVLDVPAKLSAQVRCSPPPTAARPIRWMRTRWRWSPCPHPRPGYPAV